MNHKYSTLALFFLFFLVGVLTFSYAIDGVGTKNVVAKFINGEFVGNSSIYDDGENVTIGGALGGNTTLSGCLIAPDGRVSQCFASDGALEVRG